MIYPDPDTLRVQVQGPATGPVNLLPNPSGDLGAWSWLSSIERTRLKRDTGFGFPTLRTEADPGIINILADLTPIPTGVQWVAFRALVHRLNKPASAGASYMRLAFYNADDNLFSLTGQYPLAAVAASAAGTVVQIPPVAIPAGTVSVSCQFVINGISDAGTRYAMDFQYSQACLAVATTTAALADLPLLDPAPWVTITPSVSQVTIEREAFSASTCTIALPDSAYDLPVNGLIRPGRRLRVQALTPIGTWEPIFTGRIDPAGVAYDPGHPDPGRRTLVTFTAVDALAELVTAKRPVGVLGFFGIERLLEGAGVPWNINGSVDHNQTLTGTFVGVADTEDATLVDQLTLSRNGEFFSPYVWISRAGVLYAGAPATPGVTLTEDDYDQTPVVAFDLAHVVNEVTIVNRQRRNVSPYDTYETVRGPYRDRRSIQEWGLRHLDHPVQGYNSQDQNALQASQILEANAWPRVRVDAVRIAIRSTADVVPGKALAEMYDQIRVTNTSRGIDQSDRVLRLVHTITPGDATPWTLQLVFAAEGTIARSRPVPSLRT